MLHPTHSTASSRRRDPRRQSTSRAATDPRAIGRAARQAVEMLEARVLLSTVTVTTITDAVDANLATITIPQLSDRASNPDGLVSLREAVRAARNTAGVDTVDVPAGTYVLSTGALLYDATAATNALTVRASGAAGSAVVDAQGASRILQVSGPGPVAVSGLTLKNGGGVERGGGILNAGTLTLTACTLTGNQATGAVGADVDTSPDGNGGPGGDGLGGAVYTTGTLTLDRCTFSGNQAVGGAGGDGFYDAGHNGGDGGDARGGAIYSTGGLSAADTVITGNGATGGAGGKSAFVDGFGGDGGDAAGGGIYNASPASPATLTRSTVSANHATVRAGGADFFGAGSAGHADGGGIFNAAGATMTLNACTLSGNGASADTPYDFDGGMNSGAFMDAGTDARGGGAFNAGTLTLNDTTVSGNVASGGTGAATDYIGGAGGDGLGGGIFNDGAGTVALARSTVADNAASGGGGGIGIMEYLQGGAGSGSGAGIYNLHTLSINASALSGNLADAQGGAVYNNGTLTVTASTLSANTGARGGGIDNAGTITVSRSTFSANQATGATPDTVRGPTPDGARGGDGLGGAIYNANAATLVNSTLTGNRATGGTGGDGIYDGIGGNGGDGVGGAIASAGGTVTLTACTLAGNAATAGAGGKGGPGDTYNPGGADGVPGKGYAGGINTSGTGAIARLANTIVAGNTAGSANADVRGAFVSGPNGRGGANLIGDVADATGFTAGAGGDLVGGHGNAVINAKLGSLADNGGSTKTMALLAGSPALGAGSNALAVGADGKALATDQRGNGFARISGTTVDIGAFEDQRETARINGAFYYDLNHNGARDAGEPALAGWIAYYDKNDNGRVDAGEPSATSAADGTYTISGLAAGQYNRIREDRRDAWARTQPAGAYPLGYYDVTLAAGQSATGKDFGNFNTAPIPPTAQNDAATTPHDTPTSIDVLANDADDVALSPGALTVTSAPAHGTAAVDPATARVIYTPAAGFTGDDAFAYTVRDVEGATSAPATVAVTVTPTVGPPPASSPYGVTIAGPLPAAVVGGRQVKVKQRVTVTNLSDQRIDGPMTVKVVTSADHVMGEDDAAVATLALARVKLAPHASKSFKVRFATFPTGADGTYCLMAQATGPAGTSAPAETPEVTVAAPFIDLTGAFAEPLPKALVPGKPTTVRLAVQDLGNVPARGTVNIALSAAIHGPPDTSPVALATVPVKLNLKPGAAKRYRVRFTAPADLPFGPAILGAVIDPENQFADPNVANNTFYSTRQVPGG